MSETKLPPDSAIEKIINNPKLIYKNFACNNCQGGGCPVCSGSGSYNILEKISEIKKVTPLNKRKVTKSEHLPDFQKTIDEMPLSSKIFVDKSLAIANKILKRVEQLGIAQKDLADGMGMSEANVSKSLTGMQNFTLRTISKYEAALNFEIISI